MKHVLPFAEVHDLGHSIVEVIPNDGAELGKEEADELVALYIKIAETPKMLVNRSNQYSSTSEFMDTMVHTKEFQAVAIYVPGYEGALVAESQKYLFDIPFERFLDRNEAIDWLRAQ